MSSSLEVIHWNVAGEKMSAQRCQWVVQIGDSSWQTAPILWKRFSLNRKEPRKKNDIASDLEPSKAHWGWHGAAQGYAGTCQGISVYWDLVHGCRVLH